MNHIKLFENIKLKRYIIDDAFDTEDIIYLWEVLSITDKEINFKVKNSYNSNLNKFIQNSDTLTMPISRFKRIFNIVYETDSYKDANNMFFTHIDAKKYNL